MVAEETKWRSFDMMKGARREYEGAAGTVYLLPDLAAGLAVRIEILQRKGEVSVDMTVAFPLLCGNRVRRQCVRILIPGA